MATQKPEDTGIYHLPVGTEVSAKYRGAFCEAQIKFVKKNVIFKVTNKKNGKCSHLSEECIKGTLKIGSVVEAQFPDQSGWQECTIQSTKDRSSYTVVFDDGDERTLSRGSLCLKGDRHYAKSETLDNLPLTDPENFGTPVLSNKKNRQRRRQMEDEYDEESEDQKTPTREKLPAIKGQKKQGMEDDEDEGSSDEEEENDDEKRVKWLADPLMGKTVIVEPNDKRKHWFPGLVVNPLCYERYQDLTGNHLVVRSFKTGKFLRVSRSTVKEMNNSTIPSKLDNQWKEIVRSAQNWKETRTVPVQWRIDIKDILTDSEDEDNSENESEGKKKKSEPKKSMEKSNSPDDVKDNEEEKKNHDFLEILYKFMEDRGTQINKTPVLGYKDLDLYLLYKLVQKRKGSFAITSIKEWKQIYLDLGIPKPNPAAGYNVRTAYKKYLASYEEYCASWRHISLPKQPCQVRSSTPISLPADKKKRLGSKQKEDSPSAKTGKKVENDKNTTEKKRAKVKERDSSKSKASETTIDVKTRGRTSPVDAVIDELTSSPPQLRRPGQRRRISESSSASDVSTVPSIKKDSEKTQSKQVMKGTRSATDERLRNPGGPDSEPDESSRSGKNSEAKEPEDKKSTGKPPAEYMSTSRRIRRNSTSNLSTQYIQGDKLKVKYGHGKTFKLYDAKILQVKPPEGPGEATEYLVHYAGWNSRHDEWIKPNRIVGLLEERSSVTPSPGSGSGKSMPRRPKTPNNSSRSSVNLSSSASDIQPSSRLSVDLVSRFVYAVKDGPRQAIEKESPAFVKTVYLEPLKKNLSKDIEKSTHDTEPKASEENRPISPVLVGSQRTRSSKSPYSAPTPAVSQSLLSSLPVAIALEPVKKEPPVTVQDQSHESPPAASSDEVEKEHPHLDLAPKEEYPENVLTELCDSKIPQQEESEANPVEPPSDSHVACTNEVTASEIDQGSRDKAIAEDLEQHNKDVPTDDTGSERDVSEAITEAENIPQSSVPPQQPRRTSGRRSKSPAYLSDSSWHNITKRRKCSSSVENSPSPTSSSTGGSSKSPEESVIENAVCDGGHPAPTSKRSPSPSLSISSSTSSAGDHGGDGKEKSPVLSFMGCSGVMKSSAAESKTTKTRKRIRQKSTDKTKELDKSKDEKPDEVDKKEKRPDQTKSSEYDNFDEEAPSIALEKHKKVSKRPVPLGLKYKNSNNLVSQTEFNVGENLKHRGSASCSSVEKTSSAGGKREEAESAVKKRKIKKRKLASDNPLPDSSKEKPSPELVCKHEDLGLTVQVTNQPSCVDKAQSVEETKFPRTGAGRLSPVSQVATEPTVEHNGPHGSNHEIVYPLPLPRSTSAQPQHLNPLSSSKVLTENTPPTTPEQSPSYISEDQDIETEKHSPLLDSDLLDIGDEPKDSGDSVSSSSSENQALSSHELEKLGEETRDNNEDIPENNRDTKVEEIEELSLSSPPKKKRRGRRSKRRRTTSKSQGNRRSGYGNDQESESDNEPDDETEEANARKRNESGSRCKPRKKRAKARPEPPSAPPPLPREELASMSQDDRIALLQSRMAEMRKVYHQLKQEVANIDRKRKRAKKREREAAEAMHLSHSGKGGTSPFVPSKAAPTNGKVESAGTSSAGSIVNSHKQAVANGQLKPSEDGQ